MPAARYWRAVGLEAHAGGDLELSALHVYDAGGRVDAGAALTSTIAPTAGALANLKDADFSTTARFAAAAMSSPGFALRWDFGAPVDVYGVRAGGPSAAEFLKSLTLQYSTDGGTWGAFAAELGDFIYPGTGELTATPSSAPWMSAEPGRWVEPIPEFTAWSSVKVSADGKRIAAVRYGSLAGVFTSEDGGVTWVERMGAGSRSWGLLAMDETGMRIAVAIGSGSTGFIYTSADGGVTWETRTAAGNRAWRTLDMSGDGSSIVAGDYSSGSSIYTSEDGGATWVTRTNASTAQPPDRISISADGLTIITVGNNNPSSVSISRNGGATWAPLTMPLSGLWRGASVSGDGNSIFAINTQGFTTSVHRSINGGASWMPAIQVPYAPAAVGLSLSYNGKSAVFGPFDGTSKAPVFTTDGGLTWQTAQSVRSTSYRASAVSADGMMFASTSESSGALVLMHRRDPMFADPPLRTIEADTPDFFASSPIAEFTTIKLPDVMPWRDMEFAGNGKVTGTVKEKNTPANTPLRRRVRLVREIDGLQIRETWSDAITGAYAFLQIDERHKYSVISYDYAANYRAVIADSLTPEIMT